MSMGDRPVFGHVSRLNDAIKLYVTANSPLAKGLNHTFTLLSLHIVEAFLNVTVVAFSNGNSIRNGNREKKKREAAAV